MEENNNIEQPPRYVSYLRVSTKEQGRSGLGLEAQRQAINTMFKIEKEFVEVRSGGDMIKRPILREAIEYCKATGAYLVVYKHDRLSRKTEDGLAVVSELKNKIRFCNFPGEVNKFVTTIIFALADGERELISLRQKAAKKVMKAQGKVVGRDDVKNVASQGGEVRRQMALTDENNVRAAAYLNQISNQGYTLKEMASMLNESGFKTSKNNKFHPSSVHYLLKSHDQTNSLQNASRP